MSKLYLALACVLTVAFAIPANFVNFGAAEGDTQGYRNDDDYFGPIAFDFIFYGVQRSQLYVSNNGILSFNGGINAFTPVGMSAANFPAIAIYWGDVDTRPSNGGSVWYGRRTDATLLASLSARIGGGFQANRAFVVTYDQVGYYSYGTNKLNSFQAVLVADAIGNSWVFLNYGQLQWTTGGASGGSNGLGGTPASVGFSNGAGVFVQSAESLTAAVLNTRDTLTQVNGVVIVLPPAQTCGNNEREGTEQCDGGVCCEADCTFKNTASCFCSRQTFIGGEFAQNYFCVAGDNHKFYQCLQGVFADQSRIMDCATGTHCGCTAGEECSCGGFQSPCIDEGQAVQSCN